jgi:hypothetical protein
MTPSQLARFTMQEISTGIKLNSRYSYLKDEGLKVETALGHTVLQSLPVIPGCVLFFVPSHPFLDGLINTWSREGFVERIQHLKPFFFEKPDLNNDLYGEYKEAIENHGGVFLIGVFRGRMSEGIDFDDNQARAVIAFGIPYPPVNELEIRLKREFNDEHQSENVMSGREWYDAQAFRSLFQATGRCIRHARDYGAVILIDQRFTEHLQKFPRWMKGSIQSDVPVGQIAERLSQFYVEMKQQFPPREVLHFGRPLTLSCAACSSNIMNLSNLSDAKCQTLPKREGLLRLLNCPRTDGFLFLRKGDQTALMATIAVGEICFCRSDLSGYSLVVCSCGAIIGAKMSVGTPDDIPLFDGIWFNITRVAASQGGKPAKLDTLLAPKTTLRLSMEGKGQQILACVADA